MTRKSKLTQTPPYAVENAIKRLGANLRIARLRRNLTIKEVAEKIGTDHRAVSSAEKGKLSTGIAVYVALLWIFNMHEQLAEVADPTKDEEGQALAMAKEGERVRHGRGDIDSDF